MERDPDCPLTARELGNLAFMLAGALKRMIPGPSCHRRTSPSGQATNAPRWGIWESREAHQAWYDDHIAPNLPPGMGPISPEYIDLLLTVPES